MAGEATGSADSRANSVVEVALLDLQGVIESVNPAWEDFARANGGDPQRTGVGMSYLAACDAASDDQAALEVGQAIRLALAGELPAPLAVEVPCHSPETSRWFDTLVSSRLSDDGVCVGATVTISLAWAQPRDGSSLGVTSELLREGTRTGLRRPVTGGAARPTSAEEQVQALTELSDEVVREIVRAAERLDLLARSLENASDRSLLDDAAEALDRVVRRIHRTVFDVRRSADAPDRGAEYHDTLWPSSPPPIPATATPG